MKLKKFFSHNFFTGAPTFLCLLCFYALPVIIVFVLSFRSVDMYGGIGTEWSLNAIRDMANPSYPSIIWRTLWQGVVATAVCVFLAVPISYHLARLSPRWRNLLLLLIVVPFWTNFLIRIYAWKVFLSPNGMFKELLVLIGLVPQDAILLYNQWAVLTVMIYTYIPFAILPIYAIAEKFDFSLFANAYAC